MNAQQFDQLNEIENSLSEVERQELYQAFLVSHEIGVQSVIDLAATKGLSVDQQTVLTFLEQAFAEHETEDVELDSSTLAAVAGGGFKRRSGPPAWWLASMAQQQAMSQRQMTTPPRSPFVGPQNSGPGSGPSDVPPGQPPRP